MNGDRRGRERRGEMNREGREGREEGKGGRRGVEGERGRREGGGGGRGRKEGRGWWEGGEGKQKTRVRSVGRGEKVSQRDREVCCVTLCAETVFTSPHRVRYVGYI